MRYLLFVFMVPLVLYVNFAAQMVPFFVLLLCPIILAAWAVYCYHENNLSVSGVIFSDFGPLGAFEYFKWGAFYFLLWSSLLLCARAIFIGIKVMSGRLVDYYIGDVVGNGIALGGSILFGIFFYFSVISYFSSRRVLNR